MVTILLALGLAYLAGGVTINYVMWKAHVAKVEKEYEGEIVLWELGRDADFWLASVVIFVATVGLVVTAGFFHLVVLSISLSLSSLALLGLVAGGTFSLILWKSIWSRHADLLVFWGSPIGFLFILLFLSGISGHTPSSIHASQANPVERKRVVPALLITTRQIDYRVLYRDDLEDCEHTDPIAQTMVSDLYNPVIPIAHLNAMRTNNLSGDLVDDRIAYKWHTLAASGDDKFALKFAH